MPVSHFKLKPSRGFPSSLLAEFDRVRLTSDVSDSSGHYQAGSTGTVVHVHGEGAAYEVELTHPVHAVVTITPNSLERAPR